MSIHWNGEIELICFGVNILSLEKGNAITDIQNIMHFARGEKSL